MTNPKLGPRPTKQPECRTPPALGLFFLAPLVAEFLLGNLPVTLLPALVLLAPLYGGGALLIREVTRRAGRGVPTMLVLGVGYGLLEEGIATQSLFNPHYVGADLLSVGYVPWLGIAVPWTLFVLTLHAVGSTTVPIVMAELCARERTGPWLGRPGLVVTAVLLVVGIAGNAAFQMGNDPFRASPAQLVATWCSRCWPPSSGCASPPRGPARRRARAVGDRADRAGGGRGGRARPVVVRGRRGAGGAVGRLAALAARWSVRAAWTPRHTLAAAAAALVTYAWHAFPENPGLRAPRAVDLIGNTVFALLALVLLVFATIRCDKFGDS